MRLTNMLIINLLFFIFLLNTVVLSEGYLINKLYFFYMFLIDNCEEGWTYFQPSGKCYKFFTDWKTWDEARAYCLSVGKNGVKKLIIFFELTISDRECWHQ